MKRLITALITPFKEDGSLDEAFLLKLLEHQRQGGVEAVLALGSTAESYALSLEEKYRLLGIISTFTKEHNMHLCVNVSANNTVDSIAMAKKAKEAGADSLLMLPPFYVSLTPKGQFGHFASVAEVTDLPIILYNHPGRTGVHIELSQLKNLSALPTIVGIKDASSKMDYVQKIIHEMQGFFFYSGDDSATLSTMSMGGFGLISVMSNLLPRRMQKMVSALAAKELTSALLLSEELMPFFSAMSLAPNPALIKAMIAERMGMSTRVRRPLLEASDKVRAHLKELMAGEGAYV